jgi:4-hydroxybenzoate polyprenyltransferase
VLNRWWIFLKERCLGSFLITMPMGLAIHLLVQTTSGVTSPSLSAQSWVGALILSLFYVLIRIVDDQSDAKSDSSLNPSRPLPSGRVLDRDLFFLKWSVLLLAGALNLLWPHALIPFALCALALEPWARWIELRDRLTKNRLIAILSQVWFNALVCFQVIAFFSWSQMNLPGMPLGLFTRPSLAIALWSNLIPLYLTDFCRKTRTAEDDKILGDTYSSSLGLRGAASVAFGLLASHVAILLSMRATWQLSPLAIVLLLGVQGVVGGALLGFWLSPNAKRAHLVQSVGWIYFLILNPIVIIDLLI